MHAFLKAALAGLTTLLWLQSATAPATADVGEIKITKQPGILYAQLLIMEERKLLEKHAAAQGASPLKVDWVTFSSGGAATDALLSGSVDIVSSGVSNMLLLWGKTNGQVKAIVGVAGLPMKLLTRNPDIKSIRDFGPNDRIAVPTIKVSMQATVLGIALEKEYGSTDASQKLVTNQVQLGHPEATAALLSMQHEVNTHFSLSPFQEIALKNPAIRSVLSSNDVLGGPAHITCSFTTQKFRDANPKIMKAFIAAFDEASELITKDPKAAATSYLAIAKDKATVDELATLMAQPGGIFSGAPNNTKIYADFMQRAGIIKPKAESWKDYFFSDIHDRQGS
jgi:NitT/TauT family transport system substrate-binding protein